MAVRNDIGGRCAILFLGWRRGYGDAGGGVDAVMAVAAMLLHGGRAVDKATRVGGSQLKASLLVWKQQ
jgi:hypothetical protein